MAKNLTPTDEDGIDLNTLGRSASDVNTAELLEKEVSLRFTYRSKSWDLRTSAIDGARRSMVQRKRVALAQNVPFEMLAPTDQIRVNCLATVSACIDDIPKDLQGFLLAHDDVLYALFEEVITHNEAYFLAIFGPGEDEEEPADV